MKENYKRTVTHTSYKHGNKKVKKGGFSRMIPLRITHNKMSIEKECLEDKGNFLEANANYLNLAESSDETPLWGGGFILIIILGMLGILYKKSWQGNTNFYLLFLFFVFCFLFFIFYYKKMPKKECIFNREDGLVTFPGFIWYKNMTMPIHNVIFSKSSPSTQGLGSGWLQIVRPDKTYSLYLCTLGGNMYYEDLSFLLWYMDKNRPLPPGDAFDEFRQADFERRKAEGFPKPLFPADFETPEATPEQQKERKKIGGW